MSNSAANFLMSWRPQLILNKKTVSPSSRQSPREEETKPTGMEHPTPEDTGIQASLLDSSNDASIDKKRQLDGVNTSPPVPPPVGTHPLDDDTGVGGYVMDTDVEHILCGPSSSSLSLLRMDTLQSTEGGGGNKQSHREHIPNGKDNVRNHDNSETNHPKNWEMWQANGNDTDDDGEDNNDNFGSKHPAKPNKEETVKESLLEKGGDDDDDADADVDGDVDAEGAAAASAIEKVLGRSMGGTIATPTLTSNAAETNAATMDVDAILRSISTEVDTTDAESVIDLEDVMKKLSQIRKKGITFQNHGTNERDTEVQGEIEDGNEKDGTVDTTFGGVNYGSVANRCFCNFGMSFVE